MALAEPRRRQKWTLNPRGNLWANDEDKFGKKLMEKMGWEQGKGLGLRQDGMVDPIKLRQKDNNKGIGFEGHDDTWLAHQEDFQAVLAALNAEHSNSNSNDGTEDVEEMKQKSLEETSKTSRKRVHYQKFTRGKDLSNYSKDDLGCILGTKSEKMKKKKKKSKDKEEEKSEVSEVGSQEKSHGLVMIQGGSYQDYFAKKMAELKAKGRATYGEAGTATVKADEDETYAETKIIGFEIQVPEPDEQPASAATELEEECASAADELPIAEVETSSKKKKKKKSKDDSVQEGDLESIEESEPKKKKKKKDKNKEIEDKVEEDSEEQNLGEKAKKSKKKKNKDQEQEPTSEDTFAEANVEKLKKKKNKKGKKEKCSDIPEPTEIVDSGCEEDGVKEKKKKKGKKEKKHDDQERKRKHDDDDDDKEEPTNKKRKKSADSEVADTSLGFRGSNLSSINGYGQ